MNSMTSTWAQCKTTEDIKSVRTACKSTVRVTLKLSCCPVTSSPPRVQYFSLAKHLFYAAEMRVVGRPWFQDYDARAPLPHDMLSNITSLPRLYNYITRPMDCCRCNNTRASPAGGCACFILNRKLIYFRMSPRLCVRRQRVMVKWSIFELLISHIKYFVELQEKSAIIHGAPIKFISSSLSKQSPSSSRVQQTQLTKSSQSVTSVIAVQDESCSVLEQAVHSVSASHADCSALHAAELVVAVVA